MDGQWTKFSTYEQLFYNITKRVAIQFVQDVRHLKKKSTYRSTVY